MTRSIYDIIIRPLLSEKGSRIKESANQYLFEVRMDANKVEIRQAVEKLFNVSVEKVNTLRVPGKWKRQGRSVGRSVGWKKAIVTLKAGQTLELFEGV